MDILQIFGTAAMCTLAVVCGMLSYPERNPLYTAIGQYVFRHLFFALVILSIGRVGTFIGLDTEVARYINSVSFIIAVLFVTFEVYNFTRSRGKKI